MAYQNLPKGYRLPFPACCLAVGIVGLIANPVPAQVPLHQRIDRAIAAGYPDFAKLAAPVATDADFVRRLYLDLTGSIPSAEQARAFLGDPSSNKRQQLVNRLLASPEFARHMATVFDVLLMERRPDRNVSAPEWREYLRTSFAANKPYDQLVREILTADGTDPKKRAPAKFFLDRQAEPHVMTKDIGRLFLGVNLTCAQCHDHPHVEDFKQDHYYGLYAFLNRSILFGDRKRGMVLAEKAEGEVSFSSVFDKSKAVKSTGPRLPGGPLVKEPKFDKGKEYLVAPTRGARPVPKFSRRAQLGPQLTSRENLAFRRNIANRFWAMMMGRGLVHPVDMDHASNRPSHPELLTLLADEMAARNFDIKGFLRELALTQTYQRSSELPAGATEVPADSFAVAQLKALTPEQLAGSLMQATGLTDSVRLALGKNASETAVFGQLAGNVGPFVRTFGGSAGQPAEGFQATLDQALFVSNAGLIRGWLAPRAGNLTDRLAKLQSADAVAGELYLSVLTRPPSEEERKEIAGFLQAQGSNRTAALSELVWALVASTEFRFNH